MTIDWLPVAPTSACEGHAIGETGLRERTGASIVAVIRNETPIPSPPPDFRLRAGDVAVVVATPQGIREAFAQLQGD